MGGMCDPTELTVVLLLCSHAGRYIRRQISSSMVSLDTPRTCYAVNRAERNCNIQVVLFFSRDARPEDIFASRRFVARMRHP